MPAASEFVRPIVAEVDRGLRRHQPLIHFLIGGRQTGKTTAAGQIARRWNGPVVRASADRVVPPPPDWIEQHWLHARDAVRGRRRGRVLLVLDEVQKIDRWSESVKSLWDEDREAGSDVRPLLLGSSSLLLHEGLTESLAGRFFLHRCPHWSFAECRAAFGWNLDRWVFFGGYPGAARLARDQTAWRAYVSDALIEPTLSRDILSLHRVAKPALLRRLLGYCAQHPAEIVSFTKMLGTLQDAGNTVTLAHYLRLLECSFLVSGLDQVSGRVRSRGSSPKIVFWNNGLVTALSGLTLDEAHADGPLWGRLVENAVGAHLLNHLSAPRFQVGYWRDRGDEVDFVVAAGTRMVGIEVKSGRPGRPAGLHAFTRRFPSARTLLVGRGGIALEEALATPPARWLGLK